MRVAKSVAEVLLKVIPSRASGSGGISFLLTSLAKDAQLSTL